MKKISKVLINLIWRNTIISLFLTITWLIIFDLYVDIGFNKDLIVEYILISIFYLIPIILINTIYLGVLVKKQHHFIWANILYLILPGALSLLCYHIVDMYEYLDGDTFYTVVYVFLFMNFLVGIFSIPGLLRKNPNIQTPKQFSKWYRLTLVGVFIIFIFSKIVIPNPSDDYKNKIYPQISYDIIDRDYSGLDIIDHATIPKVGYKLTWYYNCNQPFFDSLEYNEFYAKNNNKHDSASSTFWKPSDSYFIKYHIEPKDLDSSRLNFHTDQVYLALANEEQDTIKNNIKVVYLYLINTKLDTLTLQATDGNLYIIQEAKDFFGNWRRIEQYPRSWCGNSYHEIALPPNKYLKIKALKYDGIFTTELRFKLVIDSETVLYSNSYIGQVSFGQFYIKGKYLSNNLMDPYY